MKKFSNFFLKGCHQQFQFCGTPAKFRGPGHHITASCLSTAANPRMEQMLIHCIPGYVSTMFLIEYPEHSNFLLLDCGSPSDVHRIRFYMERVLLSSSPLELKKNLRLATISHCHIDHSGGAGQLYEEGVPVAWPSSMEGTYDGFCGRVHQLVEAIVISRLGSLMGRKVVENPFLSAAGFFGPYWPFPPFLATSTSTLKSRVLRRNETHQNMRVNDHPRANKANKRSCLSGGTLNDMEHLPGEFSDWWVVQLAGHVSHMVGFYHVFSRTFYAADLLVHVKGGFFPPFRVDIPNAYRETLLRVRSLEVRCLLLPHGGIVDLTTASSSSLTPTSHNARRTEKGRSQGGKETIGVEEKNSTHPLSWEDIIDQVLYHFDQLQNDQRTENIFRRTSGRSWVGGLINLVDHTVCVKTNILPDPPFFKTLLTTSFSSDCATSAPPPFQLVSTKTRTLVNEQSSEQVKKEFMNE